LKPGDRVVLNDGRVGYVQAVDGKKLVVALVEYVETDWRDAKRVDERK
jgi:preprotein translocase subunit YajC